MTKEKKVTMIKEKKITMLTNSGNYVDLKNLKEDDIKIEDIAHSLSNLCRYNGHVSRFYSVAEHSCRLARYAVNNYDKTDDYNKKLACALLMHDATEAYVGDMIYHLKNNFKDYIELEKDIAEIINSKFNIDITFSIQEALKSLDRRICFDEMYILMPEVDECLFKEKVKPIGVDKLLIGSNDYFGWQPELAKERFLAIAGWLGLYVPPSVPTVEESNNMPSINNNSFIRDSSIKNDVLNNNNVLNNTKKEEVKND